MAARCTTVHRAAIVPSCPPPARPPAPSYLDALSLLTEVADELVVRSVRDTHDAWADRFGGHPGRGITSAVCAGLGLGLRAASAGLGRLPTPAWVPPGGDSRGRFRAPPSTA